MCSVLQLYWIATALWCTDLDLDRCWPLTCVAGGRRSVSGSRVGMTRTTTMPAVWRPPTAWWTPPPQRGSRSTAVPLRPPWACRRRRVRPLTMTGSTLLSVSLSPWHHCARTTAVPLTPRCRRHLFPQLGRGPPPHLTLWACCLQPCSPHEPDYCLHGDLVYVTDINSWNQVIGEGQMFLVNANHVYNNHQHQHLIMYLSSSLISFICITVVVVPRIKPKSWYLTVKGGFCYCLLSLIKIIAFVKCVYICCLHQWIVTSCVTVAGVGLLGTLLFHLEFPGCHMTRL